MSKSKKIILIVAASLGLVLLAVLVLSALVLSSMSSSLSSWSPEPNEYVVDFDSLGEKIYIRAKAWGLAGNHEEIILSNEPIKNRHLEYFYDKQFIFLSMTELFYKKINADTLEVYADYKSKEPPKFQSKVKIKQIEFKDIDNASDMKTNPEKYGLTRVTVYKDN
jgi:hypothetical protein